MLFDLFKKRTKTPELFNPTANIVVWVEITVTNLDRSVDFYGKVLRSEFSKKNIMNRPMGILERDTHSVGLCLIEAPDARIIENTIRPMFFVSILFDALENARNNGGSVIQKPALLKQTSEDGKLIIGSNLIDGRIGYYAIIKDPDGNVLYLYSNN